MNTLCNVYGIHLGRYNTYGMVDCSNIIYGLNKLRPYDFTLMLSDNSQMEHIEWFCTQMSFVECFNGFYAWLSYFMHYYSNSYSSTHSISVVLELHFTILVARSLIYSLQIKWWDLIVPGRELLNSFLFFVILHFRLCCRVVALMFILKFY